MSLCASHVCRYPQRPEGIGSPGTEVTTGSYEPSDVGAEKRIQVFAKGVNPLNY